MYFEGTEKKLEIIVRKGLSLLTWPEERFQRIVECSQAQILSKIESEKCRAYLLSESSLFVWDDRITMITCGTTRLVDSALELFNYLSPDDVEALIYQRKNEYFPQEQTSNFFKDIEVLNKKIKGRAYRLGQMDEHHLYIFHSDKKYETNSDDTTLEILMYDLQGPSASLFMQKGLGSEQIRRDSKIDALLPGFKVDDYVFTPMGYSINALKEEHYYTVHVTPQEDSPYISFETNLAHLSEVTPTAQSVLEVFQPRSFDLVYFHGSEKVDLVKIPGYSLRSSVVQDLSCGYKVRYAHYSREIVKDTKAHEIKIGI